MGFKFSTGANVTDDLGTFHICIWQTSIDLGVSKPNATLKSTWTISFSLGMCEWVVSAPATILS